MEGDRKCILCEIVCVSKQEMDEHVRSMLHHRELEKLKGRDCGHECRVCGTTVVSLTEYASHITSSWHKQNVDKSPGGGQLSQENFDQALVDLIQKRKDKIRKEKEAAAAKAAKEEEERRKKEEFQQKLQEAKDRYRLARVWQPPLQGYHHQFFCYQNQASAEEAKAGHHIKKGRGATWHAQAPPDLQKWASGDLTSEGMKQPGGGSSKTWGHGALFRSQQNYLPWLDPRARGVGFEHSSRTNGSNPVPDKGCRWSPYPVTAAPQAEAHPHALEASNGPKTRQEKTAETGTFISCRHENSGGHIRKVNPAPKDETKASGFHRDASVSSQQADGKVPSALGGGALLSKAAGRTPSNPRSKAIPVSSTAAQQTRPQRPVSEFSTVSLQTRSRRPIPESSTGAQLTGTQRPVPESSTAPLYMGSKKTIPESSTGAQQMGSQKPVPQSSSAALQAGSLRPIPRSSPAAHETGPQKTIPQSSPAAPQKSSVRGREETNSERLGYSKETLNSGSSAEPDTSDLAGPQESAVPPSDNNPSLQSLQVSTSVLDSPGLGGSVREEEEGGRGDALEPGQSLNSDPARGAEAPPNTPHSPKLDLPHVLKRDLSKHINSKNKAGGHEPNLNIARRVRNLSGSRKHEADRDSGLKPTVRQLLSSSGSRRCVNWEQLYDELRKKQDKGKGMPRFGIEMVPNEQDCPLEGFDWDLVTEFSSQGATRKRSLSESSLAPSSFSLLAACASEEAQRMYLSSERQSAPPQQRPAAPKQPDTLMSASVKVLQRSESVGGDSSSGMEQCDGQGSGKRRRAATDGQSAEPSCLEHNSKRRKVKSRKERLHIDQLLSVSLREEELSRSLQTLDSNLIQARAALEAAYLEVQRLTLLKQQITVQMSTLRNTRNDLLKGMQGTKDESSLLKVKEEKSDTPMLGSTALPPPAEGASPPPPSLQSIPVVIKAEPQSPVRVSLQAPEEEGAPCVDGPVVPLQDTAPAAPPGGKPESSSDDSSGCRDQPSSSVLTADKNIQASNNRIPPPTVKLSPSRRGSEEGAAADCPSALNTPTYSPELKCGARVRKLKKRKSLKKAAAGAKQPESTDSEGDEEACRPRWLRQRRRASAGSQSSSCSLPADDREGSRVLRLMLPSIRLQKNSLNLCKQLCHTAEQENMDSVESMEVSAVCQPPHSHSQTHASRPLPSLLSPEPQSLACSQVSTTSDMDVCKSSESDLPFSIVHPRNSSEVSSDHGGDRPPTEGAFIGHQEAVNGMEIHGGLLYTCSGDRTVRVFDLVSHQCVGVMEGHASKVTCLLVSAVPSLPHRLYSGSSDQTIRCYRLKTRELEQQFVLSERVLCLHSRWRLLYAGLANGSVVTFDLKTNQQMDVWDCHGPRGVSCLATSQEGASRVLLVGSYDSTISVRDAGTGLLFRTLHGHAKSVLCMQVVKDLVFSGSSDHCVRVHSIHTGQLLQVYRSHSHAVTVVSILRGVMVTACLDKLVRVFDLQSQEQRQIYGGHRDMVLCMNVYKNMIYTGCYDGGVHAVRLNLSHSFPCRWQGCELVFGVREQLQEHLTCVHARAGGVQTVRWRWKECEDVLCTRSSTQTLLLHMQKHAEEDTDVQP